MKCAIFLLFLVSYSTIYSEEESVPKKEITYEVKEIAKTEHTLKMGTSSITYEAICGMLPINSGEGKEEASLYFTAYIKKEPKEAASKRPLFFCFNGGPGSSSVWLHMGLLGPKKVRVNDAAFTKPPATYEDNPYTFIDMADLVFIDPVSTGFSKSMPGVDAKQFHSVEGDVACFSEFIRLFLTQYHRWQSPKYLVGESYGTIRAVNLANHLHDALFIDVNGIVLVSMCLDFQGYDFGNGNDLPYILSLPTYAACAWYHKKLHADLQSKSIHELLAEVEKFALHEYATALLLGNLLDSEKQQRVIDRLASYTGLPKELIRASHMRVMSNNFYHELLKKESKVIGRFDGRYAAFDNTYLEDPMFVPDPSFESITAPFTSSFNQYLYQELRVKKDDPYYILNGSAVFPWNFSLDRSPAGRGYLYTSGKLRSALELNPSMNVFVLSGVYDLATPYFAANYSLNHLNLNPSLQNNIQVKTYEAGHMMYLNPKAHSQIKSDLVHFLKRT